MLDKFVGHIEEIKNKNIISVQINLLNKCTSHCKSCRKYTWPNFAWDINELKKTITVLKRDFGLQTIFFCGGDPILYKNFPELVSFLQENGIKYSLITTLLTKDKNILELIAKTAYRIHVSVDAVDEKTYKEVRGVDGYKLLCNSLSYINTIKKENGSNLPIIRFSSTIGKINYNSVFDIYNFAKRNNCLVRYNYLRIWDGLAMSDENEKVFYSEMNKIIEDERKNKNKISNASSFLSSDSEDYKISKCYLSQVSAVLDSNGDIYPCCWIMEEFDFYVKQKERAYGNVLHKTEKEIKEEFEKRKKLNYPQCNGLCENCIQYYGEVLKDLEAIFNDKKEVLFF